MTINWFAVVLTVVLMATCAAAWAEDDVCYVLGKERENATVFTVKDGDIEFLKRARKMREVPCPDGDEVKVWDVAAYCRSIQAIKPELKARFKSMRGEDLDEFCVGAKKKTNQ